MILSKLKHSLTVDCKIIKKNYGKGKYLKIDQDIFNIDVIYLETV